MKSAFFEAIEKHAPVEWGRAGTSSDRPPFVVWRFQEDPADERGRRIGDTVNSFEGAVKWTAYKGGRNWVIEPLAVHEFLEANQKTLEFRTDVEASAEFSRRFPDQVVAAHADVPSLAAAIGLAAPSEFNEPSGAVR